MAKREKPYQWGTCEKCNGPKDMYYETWCPKCDKPEPEVAVTLNLIKCLKYVATQLEDEIFEKSVWKILCDRYEIRNDSFFTFYLGTTEDEKLNLFIKKVKEYWDIKDDGVLMEVSW